MNCCCILFQQDSHTHTHTHTHTIHICTFFPLWPLLQAKVALINGRIDAGKEIE